MSVKFVNYGADMCPECKIIAKRKAWKPQSYLLTIFSWLFNKGV